MGDFDLVMSVGDGRLARDSNKARDVPSDLTFSTTWQGGFKSLDCSLLRSLSDASTEKPFDEVKLTTQGGAYTAWEGRLQRLPRTVHRQAQLAPSALGWATVLEDRQDAQALFIDRDLGRWGEPSLSRRYALASLYKWFGSATQGAGIVHSADATAWSSALGRPLIESVYDASPLEVGRLFANVQSTGPSHLAPSALIVRANGWDDTSGSGEVSYANLNTGDGSLVTVDQAVGRRVVALDWAVQSTTNTTVDTKWEHTWTDVAVGGTTGVPLTGTGPSDYGVKASDAIAWLIGEYCPDLTVGEFVDSELGIPHLAFRDPQSPGTILNAINAYHAWSWGVWEDKTVSYNPYGAGTSRTWYVRALGDGVELQQDGDDAAQLWTDIVVQYTTATGETKTVGPTGSVADEFDDTLKITDPSHPAVAAGVTRTYVLQLGAPCIKETAVAVGALMLAELNSARRAGSAQITGYVQDAAGRSYPAYMVRGGDQLVVTDVGDETPRRIVETVYTHASRSVALTLDNTLQTVEAIIAHLGARATGRL